MFGKKRSIQNIQILYTDVGKKQKTYKINKHYLYPDHIVVLCL